MNAMAKLWIKSVEISSIWGLYTQVLSVSQYIESILILIVLKYYVSFTMLSTGRQLIKSLLMGGSELLSPRVTYLAKTQLRGGDT